MHRGFSLFEILVGIGLLGMLVVTISLMLFASLRNSRKVAAVAAVNSEVAVAVDSMVQMIKYARTVDCLSSTSLRVTRLNQDVLTYSISSQRIASTSGVNTSLLTSDDLEVLNGCGSGVFVCSGTPVRTVAICFDARVGLGNDVTDMAAGGPGDVRYQTQVTLRNYGN